MIARSVVVVLSAALFAVLLFWLGGDAVFAITSGVMVVLFWLAGLLLRRLS